MKKSWILASTLVWWLSASMLSAQQAEDMILQNGKIIAVDDPGFSSRLGTIAQAMHIQNGRVLHVGTNDLAVDMGKPGQLDAASYQPALLTMVALLVVGFLANLMVKPVDARFHEPRPDRGRAHEPAMEA